MLAAYIQGLLYAIYLQHLQLIESYRFQLLVGPPWWQQLLPQPLLCLPTLAERYVTFAFGLQ
jgi:hypothetical protein